MGGILLILLILILGYNLIVNLTNISIIVKYCLGTNTLDEFWSLYFKHCFSFRAIYSSVFSLFLAILLFFVLIPIVILRKILFKKEIKNKVSNGLIFSYKDLELPQGSWFYSNANDFGFALNKSNATGNVAEDMETILQTILEFSKANDKQYTFDFMQEMYIMDVDKTAIAPLLIKDQQERVFPIYVLYDEGQIHQYKNVKSLLQSTRFKDCIYFSVKNF